MQFHSSKFALYPEMFIIIDINIHFAVYIDCIFNRMCVITICYYIFNIIITIIVANFITRTVINHWATRIEEASNKL